MGDNGVVVIFFSLVFTYENAEKDIFITETKRKVTTDEITLTNRFKKDLLKGMELEKLQQDLEALVIGFIKEADPNKD
ncbi:hypothetical protein KVE59_05050 [Helicobacter pylori]|nr:hypothetical protein KVE59_05050 [Helicobacter pylori]